VIAAAVNRQLVRVRVGWRRGPQHRGSLTMPGEGRGLSCKETPEVTKDGKRTVSLLPGRRTAAGHCCNSNSWKAMPAGSPG
jgi:hypothetical protein